MTTCKKCSLEIIWKKTGDRWTCLNPDGSDHWDACSEARTKLIQAEGISFSDEKGSGFLHRGKRHYMTGHGKVTLASDYCLPVCDCKNPPWEDCVHTKLTG